MSAEHDFFHALFDDVTAATTPRLHDVRHNIHKVCERPSNESVTVLRRILALPTDYVLPLASGQLPHAMSAADLLRSHAIQTLAHWNLETHRGAIEQAHDRSGSDIVRGVARAHLDG